MTAVQKESNQISGEGVRATICMDEINLAFANTQKLTLALCAEPSKDLYEYVASQLTEYQSSQARRFTWLVDVFYDHRVKLIISAEVEAETLYTEGTQSSEFFRTASRLTEMQSTAYLALPHLSD